MADPAGRSNPGATRKLGEAVLVVLTDTGGYDQSGSDLSRIGKEHLEERGRRILSE